MWSFLTKRRKPELSAGHAAQGLRGELNGFLAKGEKHRALAVLMRLQASDLSEPRWPHKRGDLLRSLGDLEKAAVCYHAAAERYQLLCFPERAAAMRQLARQLAPNDGVDTHIDAMEVGSPA